MGDVERATAEVKRWQRYRRKKGSAPLLVVSVGCGRAVLLNERAGTVSTLAVASVARLHRLGSADPKRHRVWLRVRLSPSSAAPLVRRWS